MCIYKFEIEISKYVIRKTVVLCAVIYSLVLFAFRQLHIYINIMNSNA